MTRKKIYIAGPISGVPDFEDRFDVTAEMLRELGYDVVNPIDIARRICSALGDCPFDNVPYQTYLKADIGELIYCNTIYMLKGWENSKGAKLEHEIAQALGIYIIYEINSGWLYEN